MSSRASMNVSLTPELAEFVRGCVGSGSYQTASEVVRESLRLLRRQREEHDLWVSEVRERIEQAYQASLDGEVVDAADVLRAARERIRSQKVPPVDTG